jgi:PST family polysaccharide transporter
MLVLMGGIGFFLSFVIFLSSPLIVRLILGSDYIPSIAVMQILAWLCFLIAVSNVLGIQIMLPFGRDKAFTSIIFGAGVINVILAVLLVPTWYELGMALSVLISELFVTAAMFIYLTLNQLNPLKTIAKEVKQ